MKQVMEVKMPVDNTAEQEAREKLFKECREVFIREMRLLLEGATGVGKTKICLELLKEHINTTGEKWDIVVSNTRLISGWYDQIKEWGYEELLKSVHIYCYQSLHKYNRITNMILDESHKITDKKLVYIKAKTGGKSVIALSGSMIPEKRALLKDLGIVNQNTVKYSLDRAVINNLVTPYEISIIETLMDNLKKTVTAGTKDKPFMVTEQQAYDFLSKKVRQAMMSKNSKNIKFKLLERMHYIYNLRSKLIAAKKIINLLPDDKKTIIFCANINQANAVCKYRYHSKTDDTDLKLFCEGKINRLAVVEGVTEGVNIPELDYAFVIQIQSNKTKILQKIGRLLRKTSNVNKIGKVFILSTLLSQDSKWVKKALEDFNPSRIKYLSYSNIEHTNSLE